LSSLPPIDIETIWSIEIMAVLAFLLALLPIFPQLEKVWIDLRAKVDRRSDTAICFLYDHGGTWRCLDAQVTAVVGAIALLLFLLFLLVPTITAVEGISAAIARTCYSLLYDWGISYIGMTAENSTSFAIYVEAQFVADILSALVIALFVYVFGRRIVRRFQRPFPTNDLKILEAVPQPNQDGSTTYSVWVSNEEGDEAANNCRARVCFKGLSWRDIVDIPNALYPQDSATFEGTNYFKTVDVWLTLPWGTNLRDQTLRSGQAPALLPIVTLVPHRGDIPEHFEVRCVVDDPDPISMGYTVQLAMGLRTLRQYGIIRILPSQGPYCQGSFVVKRVPEQHWAVSV